MKKRTILIAAICGSAVGIAIGLTAKHYVLDPYFASLLHAGSLAKNNQSSSDDFVRDQQVADHIAKLDGRLKKAACEGYIGGLKEQHLNVSPIINNACSEN